MKHPSELVVHLHGVDSSMCNERSIFQLSASPAFCWDCCWQALGTSNLDQRTSPRISCRVVRFITSTIHCKGRHAAGGTSRHWKPCHSITGGLHPDLNIKHLSLISKQIRFYMVGRIYSVFVPYRFLLCTDHLYRYALCWCPLAKMKYIDDIYTYLNIYWHYCLYHRYIRTCSITCKSISVRH